MSFRLVSPDGDQIFELRRGASLTVGRALTSDVPLLDPDVSREHAQLSPVALTQKLQPEEIERLFNSTRAMLTEWVELLRAAAQGRFPEKVTAFRPEMAVHGKYQEPCPRCGRKVRRIRYASNETNYCPECQTGGKLLADRALSRLLREDWPRSEEELEALTG